MCVQKQFTNVDNKTIVLYAIDKEWNFSLPGPDSFMIKVTLKIVSVFLFYEDVFITTDPRL